MIKKINYLDTFLVRHPVLRADKDIESCLFAGDNLESTTHFGYFLDNKLVGVASIYNKNNNLLLLENKPNNHFQIRGMAVLQKAQRKGIGKLLIKACEQYVNENEGCFIWFNSRIVAVEFYEQQGYQKSGSSFCIKNIGEHYLMFKRFVD